MSININDYKYIMFVDASGDDGYKFKSKSTEGSSFSFVVSCFVCRPSDVEYNMGILQNMKKAMLINPQHEIKSTALKRHRLAPNVYAEMKNLKGFASSLIADKRLIHEYIPTEHQIFSELTKIAQEDLSGITHSYPYYAITNSELTAPGDKLLIVIDNMKKREKESIRRTIESDHPLDYTLIFRDSKDKDYSLIQIADIFAGTIRDYYENSLPLGKRNRICKLCSQSLVNYKVNRPRKAKPFLKPCRKKEYRSLFSGVNSNTFFNTVLEHHRFENASYGMGENFIILPISQIYQFMYIDCYILQKRF